jgi:CTP:molybdopterin cytidylyltransferase MocA
MSIRPHGTIVLAAGAGARVGGPKALLLVAGEPLAIAHVRARTQSEVVVLVVSADVRDVLASRIDDPRVTLVVNALPGAWGPAASLRAAASAGVLDACGAWIVGPVDALPAAERSIEALLAALDDELDAVRFVRGHPIAARASTLRQAYAGVDVPPTLRDVLSRARVRTLPLPDDAAITTDLDTIDDVVRATGAPPRFTGR